VYAASGSRAGGLEDVFAYRDLSDRTFRTSVDFKVDAEFGIGTRLIQRVRKVRANRAPVAP
jgi:hypothetical protein